MARYTITLKSVCEAYAGIASPSVWESPSTVMRAAAPRVFDFDYPIFDETYRTHVELMILRNYYTRELCCAEVGRWKMFLEQRMNEVMPKYNPLYSALLEEWNPFWDTSFTDTHRRDVQEDEVAKENGLTTRVRDLDTTSNSQQFTHQDTKNQRVEDTDRDTTSHRLEDSGRNTTGHSLEVTDQDTTEHTVEVTDQDTTENTVGVTDQDTTGHSREVTDRDTSSHSQTHTDTDSTTDHTGTVNTVTQEDGQVDETGSEEKTETLRKADRYSDTPQNGLEEVVEFRYLTNARAIEENNNTDLDTEKHTTSHSEGDSTVTNDLTDHTVTTVDSTTDTTGAEDVVVTGETTGTLDSTVTGETVGTLDKTVTTDSQGTLDSTVTNDNVEDSTESVNAREKGTYDQQVKERERGVLDKGVKSNLRGTTDETVRTENQNHKASGLTTVEEYLQRTTGKRGSRSYAQLLAEYRNLFTSVDVMVVEDLADLFFTIW